MHGVARYSLKNRDAQGAMLYMISWLNKWFYSSTLFVCIVSEFNILILFALDLSLVHICLRLYHYASTSRRNTGKVELNSTFPAYRRCNCGTGGNQRTNIHIIYVLKLPPASSPVRCRHLCKPGFTW